MSLKLATKFAPHEAAMAIASGAGYEHAELWTDAAVLADWRAVAERCTRFSVGYALHFPNREPDDEHALSDATSLYHALGCRAIVIHQPLYDRLAGRLHQCDATLGLAVENHELSVDEFAAWAETYPGLTLDVEHLWMFTLRDAPLERLLETVEAFLARHGGKLLHVHLPGYQPGGGQHRPMHMSREMVCGVLSRLAAHNYQGMVVSEVAGAYQTTEHLAADMAMFRQWLQTR